MSFETMYENVDFSVSEPMPGRLLVRPRQQSTETASGLVLIQDENKREIIGTIIKVGTQDPDLAEEDRLNVGEMIMWSRHAGVGLEQGGQAVLLYLFYNDVICKLPQGNEDVVES